MDTARRATPDDRPMLVTLMSEFYAESSVPIDPARAERTFAALLSDPARGAAWLVGADEQIAGYVVMTLGFSMEYGGLDAFVDDLFVRPAFRGRGLGRLALETVLDECRALDVRAVHLEVGAENDVARNLYARSGFRDTGRHLLTLRLPAVPADH